MDFYISMALSIIFQVLKQAVKNKKSKSDMKSAFLKLRDQINVLYAGDRDFD
jgi:hypothetical protein